MLPLDGPVRAVGDFLIANITLVVGVNFLDSPEIIVVLTNFLVCLAQNKSA